MPPNGRGIVALIALGILGAWSVDSAGVHVQIEAGLPSRRAACVATSTTCRRYQSACSTRYHRQARHARSIKENQKCGEATASPWRRKYLAAADAAGMMVSMIRSNYRFGSGIVVPRQRSLSNRGSDSWCRDIEPELEPYHDHQVLT